MSIHDIYRSDSLHPADDKHGAPGLSPESLNKALQKIERSWSEHLDAKSNGDSITVAIAKKALGFAYEELERHAPYLRSAQAKGDIAPDMLEKAFYELWTAGHHLRKVLGLV